MPCLCRNDGQAVESRVAIQVIDLASQNIVKTADAAPAARAAAPVPWSPVFTVQNIRLRGERREGAVACSGLD